MLTMAVPPIASDHVKGIATVTKSCCCVVPTYYGTVVDPLRAVPQNGPEEEERRGRSRA